jgi:hypothetical protein
VRITLPNGFTARDYQRRYMGHFDRGGKRAAAVWHRRAGKDVTALHQTGKMAHERRGVYWHCLPTYRQAKKAIWDGFTRDGQKIIDAVFPKPLVKRKNESEMLVELACGSIVQLVGSDTIDNLVGAGPVGVTFSEYSISKPRAWDLVRPMLAENDGWAGFIFTPRGNNHGKKLYDIARSDPRWFCELLTIRDTKALPESIIDDERAAGMPEALIRQEYLCDFTAALVGSVWGDLLEQLEKRGGLEPFQHERDRVFISLDLGFTDSTSIWWWRPRGDGIEWIDCHEAHGKPLSYYFDVIDERSVSQGYKWEKVWLPHDAKAKTLATGASILERFVERYGAGKVGIVPSLSLLDGIQAMRWLLQRPDTRIHPRCAEGIEAWRQYHYEYDEDRRTFGTKPEHDWSSHYADGGRYSAVVVRTSELLTRKPEKEPDARFVPADSSFSLDRMFEDRERERRRWR